jgi:hypothetical protein
MASNTYPDEFCDISQNMLAPNAQHMHPINASVDPGVSKESDFDPGGVEVPARPTRERVDPGAINDRRRTPLIDVTSIESPPGKPSEGDDYARHAAHSSTATPTPRKL